MNIFITSGIGHGVTPLSAFDSALKDAGVHNYNLIILSSIIPPNSIVHLNKYTALQDEYGHRLYVVKAEMRSREVGKYIGAALGWYQLEDGRGIFVEYEGIDETEAGLEAMLRQQVKDSIIDLCNFRKFKIIESSIKMQLSMVQVKNSPACALVLAVYQSESWHD